MDWLKNHVYLANWLAIPVMLLIYFLQSWRKGAEEGKAPSTSLERLAIYMTFFICLGVTLTPGFDSIGLQAGGSRQLRRIPVRPVLFHGISAGYSANHSGAFVAQDVG